METKYYPNCGRPNNEGVKFCGECGSSMEKRTVETSPANISLSPKLLFLILIILIVILVLFISFSRVSVTIYG